MGQVRWEMYIQHTISVTYLPKFINVLKFDEVMTETKIHSFFWDMVYMYKAGVRKIVAHRQATMPPPPKLYL